MENASGQTHSTHTLFDVVGKALADRDENALSESIAQLSKAAEDHRYLVPAILYIADTLVANGETLTMGVKTYTSMLPFMTYDDEGRKLFNETQEKARAAARRMPDRAQSVQALTGIYHHIDDENPSAEDCANELKQSIESEGDPSKRIAFYMSAVSDGTSNWLADLGVGGAIANAALLGETDPVSSIEAFRKVFSEINVDEKYAKPIIKSLKKSFLSVTDPDKKIESYSQLLSEFCQDEADPSLYAFLSVGLIRAVRTLPTAEKRVSVYLSTVEESWPDSLLEKASIRGLIQDAPGLESPAEAVDALSAALEIAKKDSPESYQVAEKLLPLIPLIKELDDRLSYGIDAAFYAEPKSETRKKALSGLKKDIAGIELLSKRISAYEDIFFNAKGDRLLLAIGSNGVYACAKQLPPGTKRVDTFLFVAERVTEGSEKHRKATLKAVEGIQDIEDRDARLMAYLRADRVSRRNEELNGPIVKLMVEDIKAEPDQQRRINFISDFRVNAHAESLLRKELDVLFDQAKADQQARDDVNRPQARAESTPIPDQATALAFVQARRLDSCRPA